MQLCSRWGLNIRDRCPMWKGGKARNFYVSRDLQYHVFIASSIVGRFCYSRGCETVSDYAICGLGWLRLFASDRKPKEAFECHSGTGIGNHPFDDGKENCRFWMHEGGLSSHTPAPFSKRFQSTPPRPSGLKISQLMSSKNHPEI